MYATIKKWFEEQKPSVLVPTEGRMCVLLLHGFYLANLTFLS